jgi:aspartate kinase
MVNFELTQINIGNKLLPLLKDINTDNNKVVMGGFISTDKNDHITTLGRGGSDYSAAVIANCLDAEAIEIWTDVDGILTSDPSKVSQAGLIAQLSFQEAAELAYFGAKVLHPKTLGPASRKNIPVYVKNTFRPELAGTKILDAVKTNQPIKSIASRNNITVINIHSNHMYGAYGFLRKVFEVFDNHQCPVDVVTTSEVSVSITIEDISMLDNMIKELNTFSITEVKNNQSIVAVVGDGLKKTTGVTAKLFLAIKDIKLSMISLGASEVNLTIVVDGADEKVVVQKLHQAFFK